MFMIESIGWISTVLVLIGYFTNAKGQHQVAMYTWIIGDIGWITYDIFISNISHLTLSLVIIAINIYGIYKIINKEKNVG
jgi:hypothetical protein